MVSTAATTRLSKGGKGAKTKRKTKSTQKPTHSLAVASVSAPSSSKLEREEECALELAAHRQQETRVHHSVQSNAEVLLEAATRSVLEVWVNNAVVKIPGVSPPPAGSGVYFGPDSLHSLSLRVPGRDQSAKKAEFYAVIRAIESVDSAVPLIIYSDMAVNIIRSMKMKSPTAYVKEIVRLKEARSASTEIKMAESSQAGWHGIGVAAKLAKEGAMLPDVPLPTRANNSSMSSD